MKYQQLLKAAKLQSCPRVLLCLFLFSIVTYASPVQAQDCTDADVITQEGIDSFFNFTPTQGVGQSFTAPCTGRLRAIEIDLLSVDDSPIVGTLRVFEGDAASGAEIATSAYRIDTAGKQRTALQSFVPVEAGQVYTFFFDAPTSGTGNINSLIGNPYTGGSNYAGPDASNLTLFGSDMTFSADFAPVTCTDGDFIAQDAVNAFWNFIPTQGVGQSFTAPCTGRIRNLEIDLFTVDTAPIIGTLRVFEGDAASGPEIATTPYSVDATGKQNTPLLTFVPVEAGQVYTFLFDAPTSGTGNINGFNGNPYAGGATYAGQNAGSLNPFSSDLVFSIDLVPQECLASDTIGQLSKNAFDNLIPTQGVGQSFTAPCTGELRAVIVDVFSPDQTPIEGTLRIFEGDFASGEELARASYSFDGPDLQRIALPYPPALEGGTIYTYFVSAPASGSGNLYALNGSTFPGSHFVGQDPENLSALSSDSAFEIELGPQENVSETIANLTRIYFKTGGDQWANNSNWLIGDLETWHGISLVGGEVVDLDLLENGLIGEIPPELGNLSTLQDLELSGNELLGSLPAEIGNLDQLEFLSVFNNQLSGTIPPELGNLDNLVHLQLGKNQLTGDLPSELGNLAAMDAFLATENQFTGNIPPSFGSLSNLASIDLSGNTQMSGTLPIELTQLANLNFFSVGTTGLCANLDPAFQDWLADLQTAILSGCTNVANEDFTETPRNFELGDNYPNPFNPSTTISFDLAENTDVKLMIYDLHGRLIDTLVNKPMSAGKYEVKWDAKNMASGMYLYRLVAGNYTASKTLVLLK